MWVLLFAALLGIACDAPAWTPGTGSPAAADGFIVNTADRFDVLSFYNCVYTASENFPSDMAWSGTVSATVGVAGTTSAVFKEDVRRRINFYRGLVSLPADITFDATECSKDQDAALMFSRNGNVSHSPPTNWLSYTATGAEAAGKSNLAIGFGIGIYGPAAINGYMHDDGTGNEPVGHRRWLIYSQAQIMGTGDIPLSGTFASSNANWVEDNFKPSPILQFVPWPNNGYTPLPLVPSRWSLTYPGADFSHATVSMTKSGTAVSVTIVSSTNSGFADNTLVWTGVGIPPATISADTPCNVTVSGIGGAGVPASYSYTVTMFDPDVLGSSVSITGTNTPFISGANYTFNSIPQADCYSLKVSNSSAAAWTEGAEDSPVPQIQATTTGTYALRQTAIKRTGSKAFQLMFPDFSDQSFIITRDLLVTGSSQLQFYDMCKLSLTTQTLSAEISSDNGATWTSVWSRKGLKSGSKETSFHAVAASLAAYSGQIIRLRFIMRTNGGSIVSVTNPISQYGFFIDDITVTNASQLINATNTILSGTASSFTLNTASAGAALVSGSSYYMQIAATLGLRQYGYGTPKIVIPKPLVSYGNWVANQYPQATGGPGADSDHDGIPNGLEYAFGLNPVAPNPLSSLPQPAVNGSTFGVTYTEAAGVTGVTYGAQWSTDLVTWNAISDTGSNGTHIFSVSMAGQPKMFLRHSIIVSP